MSTHSVVGFENEDGTLTTTYVHFDGYPEHAIPTIQKRVSDSGFEAFKDWVRAGEYSSYGSDDPEPGWNSDYKGINDQEFGYIVKPDGTVVIWKGYWIHDGKPDLEGELWYLHDKGLLSLSLEVKP